MLSGRDAVADTDGRAIDNSISALICGVQWVRERSENDDESECGGM